MLYEMRAFMRLVAVMCDSADPEEGGRAHERRSNRSAGTKPREFRSIQHGEPARYAESALKERRVQRKEMLARQKDAKN